MRTILVIIGICCISLMGFTPANSQDGTNSYSQIVKSLQIKCICAAEWNSDGSLLAVAAWPDLQIWDTNSWELLVTIPDAYANYSIAWHPTENLVATVRGGQEEGVVIWDAITGEMVIHLSRQFLEGGTGTFMHTLAWSPDGSRIATDGVPDAILLWDLAAKVNPTVLVANDYPEHPYFLVSQLEWSSDGRWLLANGTDEVPNFTSTLTDTHLYDATTGELIRTYKGIRGIAWGAGDKNFASSYDAGSVVVWDINTGELVAAAGSTMPFDMGAYSLSWNLEENLIVSAYSDSSVRVWNVDSGTTNWIYDLSISEHLSVAWKPHSTEFAVAGDGGVVIVNFDTQDLH